ncbi:MAG TPA: magnesium transporter [Jiangellales bacterium]|nr:magnesium transporter [Jiangellales bacterium]
MTAVPQLLPLAATPLLPGSIEQYVATDVPVCGPDDQAADVRAALVGRRYQSVDDVAVCEDRPDRPHRLSGLVPVETLLAADAGTPVRDLMDADPPVVAPGLDQEMAAWKAVRRGESSLAVVDAEGRFRGLVPPARLLGVLLREHDEDLARLGGYLASTDSARHATDEPLGPRLWHRLPWLLLGLLGSAVAAWVVRGFEEEIAADVRLAFFVPGVVYMADAVGTQTEALVIRGLSVGVSIRRVFRLEVLTGLVVGLLIGGATFPAIWWALGSVELALAVSLALFAACSVATLVAMSLPWLLSRAGKDPAFGSGPLATVLQDLLSLLIYFAIAVPLVS